MNTSTNDIAIKFENQSTCYQIYDTPRSTLLQMNCGTLKGIATYSLTTHLSAAYQHMLPNEEEIRERIQGWKEDENDQDE